MEKWKNNFRVIYSTLRVALVAFFHQQQYLENKNRILLLAEKSQKKSRKSRRKSREKVAEKVAKKSEKFLAEK